MAGPNAYCLLWAGFILQCSIGLTRAQNENPTCDYAGNIAVSVFLTLICVGALAIISYLLWKRYKLRKERHLILQTDPEKGNEDYAFDNPGFKEAGLTPIHKQIEKNKLDSGRVKWTSWSPLSALSNKNEKLTTTDDSATFDGETKVVSLRSHDFTGLGFNICGNMREGIFIKDVLHRGPASESGKLNPGDRIESVTINFEHMVYEDALTILSYASPYEVTIMAKSGKNMFSSAQHSAQPGHPLFRSSSIGDFLQIGNSVKRRLFRISSQKDSQNSNHSSLKKFQTNNTVNERKNTDSPKSSAVKPNRVLETAENFTTGKSVTKIDQKYPEKHEMESQKTENKFHKFGVRVLPTELQQKSPKLLESSQNDNNVNQEKYDERPDISRKSLDEVDVASQVPQVKKREKIPIKIENEDKASEYFVREGVNNSSDIKRDANGIPQELPAHMICAAKSAQNNRRNSNEKELEKDDMEIRSHKKYKAKAPAPPEEKINQQFNTNLSAIQPLQNSNAVSGNSEIVSEVAGGAKKYNSDSEAETDNQSSVNTIELNSNDITIHQTGEANEKQNRKTASTGDLTKIQKTSKNGTATLERAQSLDITDTGMPSLSKKRKVAPTEDTFGSKTNSDDSLYDSALINKEPRLSLILDGLNTFQRGRLKKSTEWGNLEDAILKFSKENDSLDDSDGNVVLDSNISSFFELPSQSLEFNALVNKVNEIKLETSKDYDVKSPKNEIWPVELEEKSLASKQSSPDVSEEKELKPCKSPVKNVATMQRTLPETKQNCIDSLVALKASQNFLEAEKLASEPDFKPYTPEDTNISDDIKVSRHSFKVTPDKSNISSIKINDDLGTPNSVFEINSRYQKLRNEDLLDNETLEVMDSDAIDDTSLGATFEKDAKSDLSSVNDLYITALNDTINVTNKDDKPDKVIIKTTDTMRENIGVEDPLSLEFEPPNQTTSSSYLEKDSPDSSSAENSNSNHSTLTYITEIQVTSNNNNSTNISEIEIVPGINTNNQNLDSKFENYVKNFEEAHMKRLQENFDTTTTTSPDSMETKVSLSIDAEKELHKIQEIAEEQLKKLPEMRFSTSSYESPKMTHEKRQSQIEILRSNFEKTLPKVIKTDLNTSKSRIPISTSMKTPPMSPERRDSRNLDQDTDKEIIAIMTSSIHSTPVPTSLKYQSQIKPTSKNVTVTSIRNNSKIPSGLSNTSRPPVPPRKIDLHENEDAGIVNKSTDNSFKQWVFNPTNNSVTNIVVSESKGDQK